MSGTGCSPRDRQNPPERKADDEAIMAISDQHILIDDLVLHNIVGYADLHHRDVVLEIGAGTGVLTEELRKRVYRVIAIESDVTFAELLKLSFQSSSSGSTKSFRTFRIRSLQRSHSSYSSIRSRWRF